MTNLLIGLFIMLLCAGFVHLLVITEFIQYFLIIVITGCIVFLAWGLGDLIRSIYNDR